MSDQSGRQQPFRFWFPYWSNQTPPRPPPPTRGRSQPRPPAPSSRPAATQESQGQQKTKTSEAPSQQLPTTRRPSRTPTPSSSPSASPSRISPHFQQSDQRLSELPARSDAQPQPPSTSSAQPQPASRKDSRPSLPSPGGQKEQAPAPSPSTGTSQLSRTPSRITAQTQLASRKGASPSPRETVEQAPGPSPSSPSPSPGASPQPQPAIQVGKRFPSPSPQATPEPESPPEQALLPNQPKVLPQGSDTSETVSPKIPEHETQFQTSPPKESIVRQLTSQPTELGHEASQDLGPKPVPTAFLAKDVPAETAPKTPNHLLQYEKQPKETKEKHQTDTTEKQKTKPYIFPELDQKHEDIPEGKTKRQTDADQHPTETSKAEKNSEEIKVNSKRKAENIQEMKPARSQKQEEEYPETKVTPKTRPGVKLEINPKEAIKSVPRPEAFKEYNPEGPKPEIIYDEPKTSADVTQERTPNEAAKDGPRSESNEGYNPKSIPEIDDNTHGRETNESMRKLEPKLAVLVSDSKPSRSRSNTSELAPEDIMSEPEQKMQNDVSGKTVKTQHGSRRRESRINPSMGEQTNLQKEIKEDLSKLVQKLRIIGHQPGDDQGVSIITLAGKNKGATIIVGYEAVDREGSMQPKRDYKTKDKLIATSDDDTRHEQLNHAENGNLDITTNINSNVQSINNSVVHDCSCCQGYPGVHLNISSKPKGSVYLIERKETLKSQKSATSILQLQKLTYEPQCQKTVP